MRIAEVVAMANQVTDITQTPEFQRWFKGSKVVDAAGRPLRVYHGTSSHFDAFSHEDIPYRGGLLAFFSTSPEFASDYAAPRETFTTGAHVMPCYLRILKPFDFRKEAWLADEFWEETGGIRDKYERNRILMGLGQEYENIWLDTDNTEHLLTQELFAGAVKAGSWDALEADEFVEWLHGYGHDGIITLENNAVNYGIFEPNQVKSAFAQQFSRKPGVSESIEDGQFPIPVTGKSMYPVKSGSVLLKYRIISKPWPGTIKITAYAGKQAIGDLRYRFSQQDIQDMFVLQQFQRQGINTAMHEYLEHLIRQIDPDMGIKISSSLSPAGAAFYNVHPKMDAGKDWRFGRQR